MSLSVSLFIAAVGTVLHWGFLYIFSFVGVALYQFGKELMHAPIINTSTFNQFTVGLIIGGAVATAVGWWMAYRRHPFIGAMLGVSSGTVATVLCWAI